MLSALQRFTLRKWFTAYVLRNRRDIQDFDFEAIVDPQLSYAENKTMLQGLILLSAEELALTEQARAMEDQYAAHIEAQRNRAFHRLEEMFRRKPELGYPTFRQYPKTLQLWLRITDIRRVDVARAFLRKWGVRYEYRHATYRYTVKNTLGMTYKRNAQRCPPLLGIRMELNHLGQLQDRLRDAGVNTVLSGVQAPPFLGGKMANIQFDIPKELRDFFEVASEIVQECDVSISSSALQLRAMDPSHIAMVDLSIREEGLDNIPEPVKTRIILPMIAKALKAGLTHLSYDTETKKITMNGGARKFTVPTLQVSNEEVPTPKIPEMDVEGLTLNVSELKAGAGLAGSENVRILGDGKTVIGYLNGELTSYEATIGAYEGKPFKAVFNYDYLSQVFDLTSASLGATQKWNFKSASPVHATFSKSLTEHVNKDLTRQRTATFQYWLAPRIDAEDQPEAPEVEEAEAPEVEAEAQAPVSA